MNGTITDTDFPSVFWVLERIVGWGKKERERKGRLKKNRRRKRQVKEKERRKQRKSNRKGKHSSGKIGLQAWINCVLAGVLLL